VRFRRKPESCPLCGGMNVIPITYGLPTIETAKAAERGEVALGGCVVHPDNRRWQCGSCRGRFNDGGADALEPVQY